MVKSGSLQCQWLLHLLVFLLILLKLEASNFDDVDITIIKSAVAKGAVCLDGSPPAYQFDKGFGEGRHSWLLHLEGGGICLSIEDCLFRTNMSNGLGSSKLMKKLNFTGILSNKKAYNPYFYNWNRVFLRYCDGGLFSGDVEEVDPATNLHFRGARVFNVIVEELLRKGMNNAKNALLSGCSAGGTATIFHCDKFRAFFPTGTRVKCASDAGYIPRVKDLSGNYHFEEIASQAFKLQAIAKIFPPGCTSKMRRTILCFYPQNLMTYIKTPIFILNSAYDSWQVDNILALKAADPHGSFNKCRMNLHDCSSSQLKRLKDFRLDFLKALKAVGKRSSNGMFINTCFTHCQSENQTTWFGDAASKLDDKAIAEAIGNWFYDRMPFRKIEKEHVLPHYC